MLISIMGLEPERIVIITNDELEVLDPLVDLRILHESLTCIAAKISSQLQMTPVTAGDLMHPKKGEIVAYAYGEGPNESEVNVYGTLTLAKLSAGIGGFKDSAAHAIPLILGRYSIATTKTAYVVPAYRKQNDILYTIAVNGDVTHLNNPDIFGITFNRVVSIHAKSMGRNQSQALISRIRTGELGPDGVFTSYLDTEAQSGTLGRRKREYAAFQFNIDGTVVLAPGFEKNGLVDNGLNEKENWLGLEGYPILRQTAIELAAITLAILTTPGKLPKDMIRSSGIAFIHHEGKGLGVSRNDVGSTTASTYELILAVSNPDLMIDLIEAYANVIISVMKSENLTRAEEVRKHLLKDFVKNILLGVDGSG